MDLKQLIYCIDGSISPSELTLSAARELSTQMPWANTFRQFYYLNLFKLDSPDYSNEFSKGAILLSDRARFYQLTEGKQFFDWLHSCTIERTRSAEVIVDQISPTTIASSEPMVNSTDSSIVASTPKISLVAMAVDYLRFLEQQPSIEVSESIEADLIDHFLESTTDAKSWMNPDQMDKTPRQLPQIKEETELDESFFTETLAQIYIKQHRYGRALEIFKKLNLKYPEKSVYFASQIAHVESMIINNKQK